jgi:hypothetical protein
LTVGTEFQMEKCVQDSSFVFGSFARGRRTPLRMCNGSELAGTSNRDSWPQCLHRMMTTLAPSACEETRLGVAHTAPQAGQAIGKRIASG